MAPSPGKNSSEDAPVDSSATVDSEDPVDPEESAFPDDSTGSDDSVGTNDAPGTDDALLRRVAGGDVQAYSALVRRHGDRLYSYLLRLTRSPSDAEDLLQDTFLKVWRGAGSYRPGRVRASTWLHRIAHNLCVDSFRRRRRQAEVIVTDSTVAQTAAPSPELESQLLVSERLRHVERALAYLPENQRAAIILCQLQGMSNADAAIVLGVGTRALESLLARGRKSLRAAINQGDSDD